MTIEKSSPIAQYDDLASESSASELSLDDDEVSSAIDIGFDFSFYGDTYDQVYVSSNGFLTFEARQNHGCCRAVSLPDTDSLSAIIAGWWADLDPLDGGHIYHATLGSTGSKRFVTQFEEIQHYPSGNAVDFEVVLFESDSSVEIRLKNAVNDGDYHGIGFESPDGRYGRQIILSDSQEFTNTSFRISEINATDSKTISFVDSFDSFEDRVWNEQCSGCTYSGGSLIMAGSDQQQVGLVASLYLSSIMGSFSIGDADDDAFVMISPFSDISFEWSLDTGVIKFVWDSTVKKIYGESELAFQDCASLTSTTIVFTLSISSSYVSFDDVDCGSLSLDETLASDYNSLFVYVGADCDNCDTYWHNLTAHVNYDLAYQDEDDGSSSSSLSEGAIVGIVIAGFIFLCCVFTIMVNCGCVKSGHDRRIEAEGRVSGIARVGGDQRGSAHADAVPLSEVAATVEVVSDSQAEPSTAVVAAIPASTSSPGGEQQQPNAQDMGQVAVAQVLNTP